MCDMACGETYMYTNQLPRPEIGYELDYNMTRGNRKGKIKWENSRETGLRLKLIRVRFKLFFRRILLTHFYVNHIQIVMVNVIR